jgi:hypothetical protein
MVLRIPSTRTGTMYKMYIAPVPVERVTGNPPERVTFSKIPPLNTPGTNQCICKISKNTLQKPLQQDFTIPGGTHVPCTRWLLTTLVLLLLAKHKKGNKTLKNAVDPEKRQNAEHTFKILKIPDTNPKKTNPGPTVRRARKSRHSKKTSLKKRGVKK